MSHKPLLRSITLPVLFLVLSAANAESALINLKNNPFSRPKLDVADVPVVQQVVRPAPIPEKPIAIFLEATLVSENGSLVIVNGELIAPGEKIEGMRLVEVREGEAVFRKGSIRRTIKVGEPAEI